VHVTSPGHIGLLGALVAYRLGIPLVASWHTNIHEFGARRLDHMIRWLPDAWRRPTAKAAEDAMLIQILRLYRRARLLFAPNPDLVEMLTVRTGVPCYLMERGIEIDTFSPLHRTRCGGSLVIGFVGRLSVEKNIRVLADIHRILHSRGVSGYRFLVVGDGSERTWLRDNLPGVELPGILRGPALAEAYANMDAFVFPSETDTFGNVVQEALASGVPCVVSARGGPRFLIREGETGFVAESPEVYADRVAALIADASLRRRMQGNARHAAEGRTWAAVFEGVYSRYRGCLASQTKSSQIVSQDLHQNCNIR
jgi:glycosyltransferase involved in cell wall biosynthesis